MSGLAAFTRETIEEFTRSFEDLFNRSDAEGMASYYADGARVMTADGGEAEGAAAIVEFWKVGIEGAKQAQARRTITVEQVRSSGEIGYVTGAVDILMAPPGSQPMTIKFKYVTIWRCSRDGTWRLVIDISNRRAPELASAAG